MNKRTQPTETDEVNDADMSIVNEIPSHNSTNERIQTKDLPSNGISKSEYLKPKHCVPCPFLQKRYAKGARCDFLHNINPQQFEQSNGRYNDPPVTGNLPSYYKHMFDKHMSMSVQVGKICTKAFRGLYEIRQIRKFLSTNTTETLIHAFVTSHVDYCNALLAGIPQYQVQRIQRVLNAAARLIHPCPRFSHITPVLRSPGPSLER